MTASDRRWWIAGWTAVIFFALILAAKLFVVGHYKIPQNGMYPTLPAGRHLLTNNFAYSGPEDVERGDIVVFSHSQNGQLHNYIWRVVALPGENVEMSGAELTIDGRPVVLTHVRDEDESTIFQEQLGDETHEIAVPLSPQLVPPDVSLVVPAGHFFMLGDNRFEAFDSRYHGPIPFSAFLGKKL